MSLALGSFLLGARAARGQAPLPCFPACGLSERRRLLSPAGIVQRRLSNGIRVNYCRTDNEPRAAYVRLVAAGGRALEGNGVGPSGTGVVSVGTRTLSESGTVGAWRRDQARSASCCETL